MIILLAVCGAGLLAVVLIVVGVVVASGKTQAAVQNFRQDCASLGLAPSSAQIAAASFYCDGEPWGVPTVVGYCAGGSEDQKPGVLLMIHVGALPGGHWGFDSRGGSFRPFGRGEGEQALVSLMRPEVLALAAPLPFVCVFPAGDLVKGALLDLLIRARWPAGWCGLGVRAQIPLQAKAAQIQQALEQMHQLRSSLLRSPVA